MSSLVPAASIFAERSTGQSAAGTGRLAAEKVRRPAPSKLPITWPIPADQPLPEAPPRHLAHHFENPAQQLGAATLGMFIFLATEVMMFGGLFCLYAVFRNLYPAAFDYGAGLLDTRWGLLNTVILLLSSLTMAMAVQCARTGQRQLITFFLALTIVCSVCFLGVKAIEYRHKIETGLLWGDSFRPLVNSNDGPATASLTNLGSASSAVVGVAGSGPDVARGKQLFLSSCAACHGPGGEGMDRVGLPLRDSAFVASNSPSQLVEFIKTGRQPGDPQSRMNALMPARGGNPFITDDELGHIAAYVRSLNGETQAASPPAPPAAASPQEIQALIPRWIGTPPQPKDAGLSAKYLSVSADTMVPAPRRGEPPPHTGKYFGLYFLMTGLHGVHLLAGMGVVGWLMVRASRWQFSPAYHTPVELGGLYWHLVDLIWIFLFPLLYLVH